MVVEIVARCAVAVDAASIAVAGSALVRQGQRWSATDLVCDLTRLNQSRAAEMADSDVVRLEVVCVLAWD